MRHISTLLILTACGLMACSLWAQAQSIDRTQVLYSATAPSGACGYGYIVVVKSTGDAYSCDNGTWGLIGGAGTVTSVSGTPNQIVCNGTVSITCGLANPLTAPGVANFPSGIITGTPGDASSIGVYSADGTEVVWLGATTGYNGTNTWDGNPPTPGYFWGAYNVSGDNATVGWQAAAGCTQNCTIGATSGNTALTVNGDSIGDDVIDANGNNGNTALNGTTTDTNFSVGGAVIVANLTETDNVGSGHEIQSLVLYAALNGTNVAGDTIYGAVLNANNNGSGTAGTLASSVLAIGNTGTAHNAYGSLALSPTCGTIISICAAYEADSGWPYFLYTADASTQELFGNLAGSGTRMVTASSTGQLGTATIPTGTNYNGFGMWQITVPVSSNFTAFNTTSQTITSGTHFLSINSEHSTGGGAHYISGLHTACPTAPWTIWALISIVAPNSGGATNTNVGIEVDDGTKYVTVGPEYPFGSSQILAAFSFSNFSTYNATIGDNAYQMSNTPIWYYASNSGGTLTLGYSIDGTSLTTLGTSTYLSANTNCGMFADNSNANNGVIADVFAWNVFNTAGASLVAQ